MPIVKYYTTQGCLARGIAVKSYRMHHSFMTESLSSLVSSYLFAFFQVLHHSTGSFDQYISQRTCAFYDTILWARWTILPSASVQPKPLFWFRSDTETETQIGKYFLPIL